MNTKIQLSIRSIVGALLFVVAICFGNATASAQSDSVQTTPYRVIAGYNALDYRLQQPLSNEQFAEKNIFRNLFLTTEAGASLTHHSGGGMMSNPDFGLRAGLGVGTWFTPVHGLKLGFNAGVRREEGFERHYYAGFSADYLMNLTALAYKYDPNRTFELIGVAGVEYQKRFHCVPHGDVFGVHLGLQARINATPTTFFYIEPRVGIYSDEVNRTSDWQKYDWDASVLIGMGYRVNGAKPRSTGRLENTSFGDNSFYGFSAGVSGLVTTGRYQIDDVIGATASLYLGRWASSISGWRALASVGNFGLEDGGRPKYVTAEVDYLFNINSALNGFNPASKFNTNLILGPVIGLNSYNTNSLRFGVSLGLQGVLNLTDNLQLVVEPRAAVFNRHFVSRNQRLNILGSVNVGFQYRLGNFKENMVKYNYAGSLAEFKGKDNTFMSVMAGLMSRRAGWTHNATASVALGRWFTPLSALRITADADYFHRTPRLGVGRIGADYMLNLATLFAGYEPDRIFNLSIFGGLHGGVAWYKGDYHGVYGVRAGAQASLRLSRNLDFVVEPQLSTTRAKGHPNSLEPNWRMMLGLSYRFGGSNAGYKASNNNASELKNYFNLMGGPGLFSEAMRDYSINKWSGGVSAVYGRKLSALSNVQFGMDYDFLTRPSHKDIGIGTLHADYLFDLTGLSGIDLDQRISVGLLAGIGVAWSNYPGSSVGLAAIAGAQLEVKVAHNLGIVLQPRCNLWQPRVCVVPGNSHHFTANAKIMAGFKYHF